MPFFIIFLIVPLIEIALFVAVGDEIGLAATLLLCVLTAAIGAILLREQGLKTLFSARESLNNNELPVNALFDGICLAIAGIMLMTPGFFTDTLGFSLLIPPVRRTLQTTLARHFNIHTNAPNSFQDGIQNDSMVIEAEFEHVDETDENNHGQS